MISRSADFESAASTDFAIQAVIHGAQCETWTHKSFDSSFWDYSVYRFRQSRWCPFTESNYELIITSDLLCHLTKRALAVVAGIGPAIFVLWTKLSIKLLRPIISIRVPAWPYQAPHIYEFATSKYACHNFQHFGTNILYNVFY